MSDLLKYGSESWLAWEASERLILEESVGQVWSTTELQTDFIVHSFLAPFVMVEKNDTGEKGSLMFQTDPRFYYSFTPDVKTGIFVKRPNRT